MLAKEREKEKKKAEQWKLQLEKDAKKEQKKQEQQQREEEKAALKERKEQEERQRAQNKEAEKRQQKAAAEKLVEIHFMHSMTPLQCGMISLAVVGLLLMTTSGAKNAKKVSCGGSRLLQHASRHACQACGHGHSVAHGACQSF